jgi:hypothetical protein
MSLGTASLSLLGSPEAAISASLGLRLTWAWGPSALPWPLAAFIVLWLQDWLSLAVPWGFMVVLSVWKA